MKQKHFKKSDLHDTNISIFCRLAECNNSCDACLNVFAQTSGDFSHCAIVNSRPIEICESCVEPYIYLTDSFAEILKVLLLFVS